MGSPVTTRKSDEKLRTIAIIGNVSHQILGAKLPSTRQVLEVFFHNMRFVMPKGTGTAKDSAKLTMNAVMIFWQQARIPTRRYDHCVDMLLALYEQWKRLQKRNLNQMSSKMKEEYDKFVDVLDDIFDIAEAKIGQEDTLSNKEDANFLKLQRQKGRPGSMIGVDKKLADKEERSQQRKRQEEARKLKHSQAHASAMENQQSGECSYKIQ